VLDYKVVRSVREEPEGNHSSYDYNRASDGADFATRAAVRKLEENLMGRDLNF